MNYLFNLNRRIRRHLKSLAWDNLFNYKLVQILLGFTKNGLIIVDNLQNIKIEYSCSSVIGNELFFSGFFEENEIIFFTNKLAIDDEPVILDVGANIGLHTIKWLKSIPKATAFAFEPSPETRDFFEKSGYETFFCCDDNAYSSLKDTQRKKVISSLQVPVTTIDEFVEAYSLYKISLIKIDVEGFEREVILGAINTLKTLKPDLFVEIYGGRNSNSDPEGTVRLICSLGYQAYVLINGVLRQFENHSDFNYNYYFSCK